MAEKHCGGAALMWGSYELYIHYTQSNCLYVVVTSDRTLFYMYCNLARLSIAMSFVHLQPARKGALSLIA